MNILSIGNSFSQDAQRYLHQIAKADGVIVDCFNLCIGGCALSEHHKNLLSEERAYTLEMNGNSTGFYVSLNEALINREWDIITLQQVSHLSPNYDTYQPFLDVLAEHIKKVVPNAKIAIHQTWAYEQGSERLCEALKYSDCREMLADIVKAYQKAAERICADFIIPSGEVFGALFENGIEKIHRDTFHASRGVGRYALGLTWYKTLTDGDIQNNSFSDFDEEISAREIEIAKKSVEEIVKKYDK